MVYKRRNAGTARWQQYVGKKGNLVHEKSLQRWLVQGLILLLHVHFWMYLSLWISWNLYQNRPRAVSCSIWTRLGHNEHCF